MRPTILNHDGPLDGAQNYYFGLPHRAKGTTLLTRNSVHLAGVFCVRLIYCFNMQESGNPQWFGNKKRIRPKSSGST